MKMMKSPFSKTIFLCDPEPVAVAGLRAVLADADDLSLAGECASPLQALDAIRSQPVAVLLIDKSVGWHALAEVLSQLRGCGTGVVVSGQSLSQAEGLRLLQAGARGVIRETAPV